MQCDQNHYVTTVCNNACSNDICNITSTFKNVATFHYTLRDYSKYYITTRYISHYKNLENTENVKTSFDLLLM